MQSHAAVAGPSDDQYTIGVLCGLLPEAVTVTWMLDETFADNKVGDKDEYPVYTGRIGHQYVVIERCNVGKKKAAEGRAALLRKYTKIEIVFVVGIAGGVPTYKDFMGEEREEILGDVVISTEILPHDEIRRLPQSSEIRADPKPLKEKLRNFAEHCSVGKQYEDLKSKMHDLMKIMGKKLKKNGSTYHIYPGAAKDVLYRPDYPHMHDQECDGCKEGSCEKLALTCTELKCAESQRVERERLKKKRTDPKHEIHFGIVASGDSVMKSGEDRDRIAGIHKYRRKIVAFEMEGAGALKEDVDVIVIKGICDYSDSHKEKSWQKYAAFTGAVAFRAFLETWANLEKGLAEVNREKGTIEIMTDSIHNNTSKILKREKSPGPKPVLHEASRQDMEDAQSSVLQDSGALIAFNADPSIWDDGEQSKTRRRLFLPMKPTITVSEPPSAIENQNHIKQLAQNTVNVIGSQPSNQFILDAARMGTNSSQQRHPPPPPPPPPPPAQLQPQASNIYASHEQPSQTPAQASSQTSQSPSSQQMEIGYLPTPGETPTSLSASPGAMQPPRPDMKHFPAYASSGHVQPPTPPQTPPLKRREGSISIASVTINATQDTSVSSTVGGSNALADQEKIPVTQVPDFVKACENHDVITMNKYLNDKLTPIDLDSKIYGCTVLHLALGTAVADNKTMNLIAPVVEALILHGANLNAEDDNRMRPLHYCALTNNIKAAELLLDRSLKGRKADILAVDSKGQTALNLLAEALTPDIKFAVLLIKKRAKIRKNTLTPGKNDQQRDVRELIKKNNCYFE